MDVVFTAGRRHGGPFFLPYLEEGERREGKERRPNPPPQTHDEKPCPFSVQVPSLLPLVLFSPPPQGRSGKGKEGTDPFSSTTLRKVREEMDSNGGKKEIVHNFPFREVASIKITEVIELF